MDQGKKNLTFSGEIRGKGGGVGFSLNQEKLFKPWKTMFLCFQMSLKIYFCGSIRGGRGDAAWYAKLVAHLKTYGTVLTEHVGDAKLLEQGRCHVFTLRVLV